jgi:hypothetical protein
VCKYFQKKLDGKQIKRLGKTFKKNFSILPNRNMKAFKNSITMSDGNAF